MSTKLSSSRRFLEKLRGKPLSFGQLIESLRICDEISQVELANKMKMSRAHLCDIEKGRRSVGPETAARFAQVLGYSASQFVSIAIEDQLKKAGLRWRVTLKAA